MALHIAQPFGRAMDGRWHVTKINSLLELLENPGEDFLPRVRVIRDLITIGSVNPVRINDVFQSCSPL